MSRDKSLKYMNLHKLILQIMNPFGSTISVGKVVRRLVPAPLRTLFESPGFGAEGTSKGIVHPPLPSRPRGWVGNDKEPLRSTYAPFRDHADSAELPCIPTAYPSNRRNPYPPGRPLPPVA